MYPNNGAFANIQQLIQRAQQIRQAYATPQDFLRANFPNVPQQYTSDPNQFIQYMLNNNMIDQQRVNYLNNLMRMIGH